MTLNKDDVRELRLLTKLNDHNQAYVTAATKLGLPLMAEKFAKIQRRNLELGHLPHDLYCERYELYQELMAYAKAHMSKADYDIFYMLF